MSRAVTLNAAWILVVALSSFSFMADADEQGSIAPSENASEKPTGKDAESIAARRIRFDRIIEESFQRRLLKRVTLKFNERELQEVLSDIAKEHDLPMAIDRATLADEGVALDQTLSLDVHDITLRSALNLILNPYQLDTVLQDKILIVTTAVKAGEALENRVYDVDRLLLEDEFTPLIEVVTSCVHPDQWDEVGGPCSVRELNKTRSLVVRATQRIHESLASLLVDLDGVIHPGERRPAANPIRERELAIRQDLVERCSIDFDDVPLERALTDLAATNKLQLWTDLATLADEGIAYDQPVTAHLKGVPVESALNHVLRPFGLTWFVDDEVLKVTSMVKAGEHLVTRVYDVRDLARKIEPTWPPRAAGPVTRGVGGNQSAGGMGGGYFTVSGRVLRQQSGGISGPIQDISRLPNSILWETNGYDLAELIQSVTSTIQPDSWDEVGGPGSIREFHHALVIRQTAAIHDQIEILLHKLRSDLRRHAEKEAAKRADPHELQRVVYDLVDPYHYSPDELAKLIPESIAPESWKSAGGKATLQVQPSSLVITQTPAVHKEIVKLLFEVVLHQRVE